MLLFPKSLPHTTDFEAVSKAFQSSLISDNDEAIVTNLNEQRRKFYLFFLHMNPSIYREITDEQSSNLKSYLYNTYDLMEVLCTKGSGTMHAHFESCLSNGTRQFKMEESTEACASAEIIFSRYCYAFGLLKSVQGAYSELEGFKGNFEQLSKRIKYILKTLEDATVRMAKLFYLKDIVWSGLESCISNYRGVAEFNYFLLEAIYL